MKRFAIFLALAGSLVFGQEKNSLDFEMDYDDMKLIDVNFDGYKDLIIPTKHPVNLKGQLLYDVYVSTKKGKLIYSEELSNAFLGDVYLDAKHRRIYSSYFSCGVCGFCWSIYEVEYRKPLKNIDTFYDRSSGSDICSDFPSKPGFRLPKTAILLNNWDD